MHRGHRGHKAFHIPVPLSVERAPMPPMPAMLVCPTERKGCRAPGAYRSLTGQDETGRPRAREPLEMSREILPPSSLRVRKLLYTLGKIPDRNRRLLVTRPPGRE